MATTYKVLGQLNPLANTDTTLYTVPGATQSVCSTLTICNQAATAATFRVAIRIAGAPLAAPQYIAYDTIVPANDTVSLTIGLTLSATDIVTVRGSTTTLSFNLFGSETA